MTILSHRNFQTFDTSAPPSHPNLNYVPPSYAGGQANFLDPMQPYGQADMNTQKTYIANEFEDEPPLLEGERDYFQKFSKIIHVYLLLM